MGGRDRARRHRGTARRRGGHRDPAPGQPALPHPEDPRGRKPAQRCQRTPDLPRRGRPGCRRAHEGARVRAVRCAGAVRKPHCRLPVRAGLDPDHAPHHRGAERNHHAIRRHLHGVDRRRAYRAVRHSHHRRLCDHDRPHRARAYPGAAARGLLCGVGNRRVRAQRAGVHYDRHAAQSDLVRARRRGAVQVLQLCRRDPRRRDPRPRSPG